MKVSFLENQIKEKLFANGILVSSGAGADQGAVYMALINQFGIRVADDASFALLNKDVLKDVKKCWAVRWVNRSIVPSWSR